MIRTVLYLLAVSAAGGRASEVADLMQRVSTQYRNVTTEREDFDVLLIAAAHPEDYTADEVATLVENGGRGVTRKHAVRRIAYRADRRDQAHVLLTQPPDDAGTEFLVVRGGGESPDEQRLYSPALKRARIVAAGDENAFVGTTFSLEDVRELTGERIERWQYRTLRTDTLAGRPVTVVDATPVAGQSSGYAGRILWIDTERSFPLRIEYRNRAGQAWKELHNSRPHEVRPGVWRSDLVAMRDLRLGEATILRVTARAVDSRFPPNLFDTNQLGSGDAAD